MAGELGLNDHHHSTVVNYMRFASYKRTQNLRSVEVCFQDLKDSRLTDDTFTVDEVTDMLDGLEAVVRGEVESELINTSHTNVLLLRQLFQQAEKWHLKLQADISELENRELIEMIAKFEESQFSGSAATTKPTFELKRLDPMEAGGVQLLQNEIDRLNEENNKLKDRLKQVESQAMGALQDKSKLEDDLRRTQGELGSERNKKPVVSADTGDMEGKMNALKSQMEQNMKMTADRADTLEGDLISSKHRLLEIQEQLEMKEKDTQVYCSNADDTCHNGATCTEYCHPPWFRCDCPSDFKGEHCTLSVHYDGIASTCKDYYNAGHTTSGVLQINPGGSGAFDVYCDMDNDGGGWTIFQKRQDGSVEFYRTWSDYVNGFGSVSGEYWLGLEKMYRLASSTVNLRVDLEDWNGNWYYARYYFYSHASNDHYRGYFWGYYGNAGDSLSSHNGYQFSTYDADHDGWGSNCASSYHGAWWYTSCHASNLNGYYINGGNTGLYAQANVWYHLHGHYYGLKTTEMKIRA